MADNRKKIRVYYTCSDYVKHYHRWRWSARLCGWFQKMFDGR